jgi:hypothetical protein
MELRHLYALSEMINEKIEKEELPLDILDKMEIKMVFSPTTFYGIDKEFYYLTHNSSYEGFVHSEVVNAKINGVKFNIHPERPEPKKKEVIEMI